MAAHLHLKNTSMKIQGFLQKKLVLITQDVWINLTINTQKIVSILRLIEILQIFKDDVKNLVQSADHALKGSYRYQDPAYIYVKEINGNTTVVVVNPTDGEYITSVIPSLRQLKNLGLDKKLDKKEN